MPGAPEPSGRQLNPTRRTTSCLEDQDKKMPKENSPAEWMPKVHFQTGGIRPISDRHPQEGHLRNLKLANPSHIITIVLKKDHIVQIQRLSFIPPKIRLPGYLTVQPFVPEDS